MTEAMQAAVALAKRLTLPLTHRNLYVVEKAIEAEATRCRSVGEAAEVIYQAASKELFSGRVVNYFFFEDARWRAGEHGTRRLQSLMRESSGERRDRVNRMEAAVGARDEASEKSWQMPQCFKCQDTREVWNYGPGQRRIPCPDCSPLTTRGSKPA